MFQRTLKRLTVLNSVVFFMIFLTFGAILYGFVAYRLFDKIDDSMQEKASSYRISTNRNPAPVRNRALLDPRIFLVLRGTGGEMINLFPNRNEEIGLLTEVASQIEFGGLQTRDLENHIYRIVSVPYAHEENRLQTEIGFITVQDVIAVSIVDPEIALLKNLFWIIISGLIIGMIIIILAGYSLARRAMVPIKVAWEKQQQFVADASHELRTPLTVIKSNAELMLRHPAHTIEEESNRVTNIVREVRRMTKLVSGLLTLARSDANQAELNLAPALLNEVVNSAVEQFQPLAELEGICINVDIKEQLEVVADKERLHQLFVILLDNAVKYTPASGQIALRCRRMNDNVVITVEDTGYGIAPADLQHIFDRFYRGDKTRSRANGGTGLGLAIAKWIVEKHGGKIEVESEVGTGTKFHVVLPTRR